MLFVLSYENWHKIFIVHIYIYIYICGKHWSKSKGGKEREKRGKKGRRKLKLATRVILMTTKYTNVSNYNNDSNNNNDKSKLIMESISSKCNAIK